MADLKLKYLDQDALDRINARVQGLSQGQGTQAAPVTTSVGQPTVTTQPTNIQPAAKTHVNLWDVLKEVPRAFVTVEKETIQGLAKSFAKAGVTATKTIESV